MHTRRRILIAVDGSECSLHAVEYVANLCSRSDVEVDLLHVLPLVSEELIWQINLDDDFRARMKEKYDQFNDECNRMAQQFLDRSREILMYSGLSPHAIGVVLQQWQAGIARDIVARSAKGYDAVVVGRRGIGRFESILLGSVSTKVVEAVDQTPVWVVGGAVGSQRMLLAVDASENSRKAVHYAAPYAADSDAEVTLLHVLRKFFPGPAPHLVLSDEEIEEDLKEDLRGRIQKMFDDYKNMLETKGVRPEKITTRCSFGSFSRAADILSTARDGGYGTVVMGRRGISVVREFLMGRVTTKVLHGAEGLVVWIVP